MKQPEFSSTTSSSSRRRGISFYLIVLLSVFIVAIIYSEDLTCILSQPFLHSQQLEDVQEPLSQETDIPVPFAVRRTEKSCNLFEGSWVYDEESRPHYKEHDCPYIEPQNTCQAHGRPEKRYQHWRWQPQGCSLPSFNATFMLEKLRGKRMMFIGDSLNRGQFLSMVCLLQQAIPKQAKSFKTNGSLIIFRAMEYNASIEYYWAPFFVESNADHPYLHRVIDRIIRVGSINRHARHWKGVDILVGSTYVWWMRGPKMKILRGSFLGDMKNITEVNTEDAYRMGLRRMVMWLEKNMDPHESRIFFTSMSPLHARGYEWGGKQDDNCYNQTTPIEDPNYWGFGSSKTIMQVVKEVLGASTVPVTVLNITQLSEYRRDAHSSIYRQQPNPLTREQLANPRSYADCVHWCLPGVPDTWNELLYAKLFFP